MSKFTEAQLEEAIIELLGESQQEWQKQRVPIMASKLGEHDPRCSTKDEGNQFTRAATILCATAWHARGGLRVDGIDRIYGIPPLGTPSSSSA